jgi:hypothetical protein
VILVLGPLPLGAGDLCGFFFMPVTALYCASPVADRLTSDKTHPGRGRRGGSHIGQGQGALGDSGFRLMWLLLLADLSWLLIALIKISCSSKSRSWTHHAMTEVRCAGLLNAPVVMIERRD